MFEKITEKSSRYRHLEQMSSHEILVRINQEDRSVPFAVERAVPQIEKLVEATVDRLSNGGRMFYIGSGTSGRLGILDASELPPTFGVADDLVVALIAGGDSAIRKSAEHCEDDTSAGWEAVRERGIGQRDLLVGITASGTTPFVLGALKEAKNAGITTAAITCNPGSPAALAADFPIEVEVGPEFVTGSTRMKAGTAQKLVLNMLSTCVMIRLGRVQDNEMVDMRPTNEKLLQRGIRMICKANPSLTPRQARALLLKYGSVREALKARS